MILGILDRERRGSELKQHLLRVAFQSSNGTNGVQTTAWANEHLALASIPHRMDRLDQTSRPFVSADRAITVMFEGKIYNIKEIKTLLGSDYSFRTQCSGEAVAYLYEKYADDFLIHVNGKFAFALWDERKQTLILGRDRLGIEPLFYSKDENRLIFSSSLRAILATGCVSNELSHEAVLQYLLYCYNPADQTFLRDVHQLPAGHLLRSNTSGVSIKKYWRLSFAETEARSDEQYREEILNLIEDAIRIRLEAHRPLGVFLSGGTDSSTIVSLASQMSSEPIYTFSFRCDGRSYDESQYARLIAERCGTRHSEIPYGPDHLSVISTAVRSMDEPFCDIGVEIGTYLLGQAAREKVSYIFSGEGGDELFGGHPVYIADKVAAVADRLPRVILNPLTRALQRIPDSDQKKNLQVKLKRFAYSLSFPSELLSHRWRIYYRPQELRELCADNLIHRCNMDAIFDAVLKYNNEADGRDQLSRSLYSDYQTLISFYFRRLGLLRPFSVESRLPLMDHRLVEYAARIPSYLKLRGLSDTKYIYKKALESVLPREILYDRPKLGHSVPMKNWLRENGKVRAWVLDVLSDRATEQRGLFRPGVVRRMVQEHLSKTHNHSHRLWALVVLELWLRDVFAAARSEEALLREASANPTVRANGTAHQSDSLKATINVTRR